MQKNGYLCIQSAKLNRKNVSNLLTDSLKADYSAEPIYENLSVIGVAVDLPKPGSNIYKVAFAFYSPNERSPFTKAHAKVTAFGKLRSKDNFVEISASNKKIYEIYIEALSKTIELGLAPRWLPTMLANASRIKIGLKKKYRVKNSDELIDPTVIDLLKVKDSK